jgi:hypothetical protein
MKYGNRFAELFKRLPRNNKIWQEPKVEITSPTYEGEKKTQITDIPLDNLVQILSYLDGESIKQFFSTNKKIRSIIQVESSEQLKPRSEKAVFTDIFVALCVYERKRYDKYLEGVARKYFHVDSKEELQSQWESGFADKRADLMLHNKVNKDRSNPYMFEGVYNSERSTLFTSVHFRIKLGFLLYIQIDVYTSVHNQGVVYNIVPGRPESRISVSGTHAGLRRMFYKLGGFRMNNGRGPTLTAAIFKALKQKQYKINRYKQDQYKMTEADPFVFEEEFSKYCTVQSYLGNDKAELKLVKKDRVIMVNDLHDSAFQINPEL